MDTVLNTITGCEYERTILPKILDLCERIKQGNEEEEKKETVDEEYMKLCSVNTDPSAAHVG